MAVEQGSAARAGVTEWRIYEEIEHKLTSELERRHRVERWALRAALDLVRRHFVEEEDPDWWADTLGARAKDLVSYCRSGAAAAPGVESEEFGLSGDQARDRFTKQTAFTSFLLNAADLLEAATSRTRDT